MKKIGKLKKKNQPGYKLIQGTKRKFWKKVKDAKNEKVKKEVEQLRQSKRVAQQVLSKLDSGFEGVAKKIGIEGGSKGLVLLAVQALKDIFFFTRPRDFFRSKRLFEKHEREGIGAESGIKFLKQMKKEGIISHAEYLKRLHKFKSAIHSYKVAKDFRKRSFWKLQVWGQLIPVVSLVTITPWQLAVSGGKAAPVYNEYEQYYKKQIGKIKKKN